MENNKSGKVEMGKCHYDKKEGEKRERQRIGKVK